MHVVWIFHANLCIFIIFAINFYLIIIFAYKNSSKYYFALNLRGMNFQEKYDDLSEPKLKFLKIRIFLIKLI